MQVWLQITLVLFKNSRFGTLNIIEIHVVSTSYKFKFFLNINLRTWYVTNHQLVVTALSLVITWLQQFSKWILTKNLLRLRQPINFSTAFNKYIMSVSLRIIILKLFLLVLDWNESCIRILHFKILFIYIFGLNCLFEKFIAESLLNFLFFKLRPQSSNFSDVLLYLRIKLIYNFLWFPFNFKQLSLSILQRIDFNLSSHTLCHHILHLPLHFSFPWRFLSRNMLHLLQKSFFLLLMHVL